MKWIIFFCCALGFSYANETQGGFDREYWEGQKAHFEKYGYVWIKKFYSPEQVLLLRDWADAVNRDAQTLLGLSKSSGYSLQELAKMLHRSLIVVPEAKDPQKVCRAEDLLSCYPDLHHFIFGTVTTYLRVMLGEPYTLFKDKINFKWPGGGAFPSHQDFPAFEFFGPREHISAMVCIDPATIENGCLYIAEDWKETFANDPDIDPELLQKGMAILPYVMGGSKHGSIEAKYCEQITWLPIEAEPGDVVFFDSYTPHYSEINRSTSSRRAMFFTHNRLKDGEHREAYYHTKREDPDNPAFHFATPTKARTKDSI